MPQPGITNLRPITASSPTSPMASERSSSPMASFPSSPAGVSTAPSTAASKKSPKSQASEESDEEVIYKDARDGVEWIQGFHGWEPRWARLPKLEAIERVCRDALQLAPKDMCTVTFYAAGSFNRVYLVQSQKGLVVTQSIMRISLPVEPGNKTECEVTTMRFVDRHTMVPVPRVIAFDDDDENEIGFEWILMELATGSPLYKRWRKMSLEQKIYVTEQIANFHSQLFQQEFKGIGSLHLRSDGKKRPKTGMLVSLDYFMGDHFDYDVPHGPFRTSHDWVKSILQTQEIDETNKSKNSDDKETREDAKYRLWAIRKLKWLLPKILPEVMHPTERTVLWHNDLHEQNILINDDCKVTGILDWEFTFAAPVWMATKFPKFLCSHVREQEPDPATYAPYDPEAYVGKKKRALTEEEQREYEATELANDGKSPMYWDDLEVYEKTQMRKAYAAKMAELWPEYKTLARHSELMNDFVDAVNGASNALPATVTSILDWVLDISFGKFPRFLEVSDDDMDPRFRKQSPMEKDDDEILAECLSSDDEDEGNDGGDDEGEDTGANGEGDDHDDGDGDEKVKQKGVEVAEEDNDDQELDEKIENKDKPGERDEGKQGGHVMEPVQAFSAPPTTTVDGDAQTAPSMAGIVAFVALLVYLLFVV